MAAPAWPPRPDLTEQRDRSFPSPSSVDRHSAPALRAALDAAVRQRRAVTVDRSANGGVTVPELRAALTTRLDDRNGNR
jgi:hypothetical protein